MTTDGRERARRAMERGPIVDLELAEEDKEGLSVSQRMTLSRKVAFLRAFARRGIILDGTTAAECSRKITEYWRDEDEWFSELFDAALEEAGDRVEAEAHRRAVEGVDEPVIYQGMPTMVKDAASGEERVLTVKRYSDSLLTTLLKGHKQEKYRENSKVTHDLSGQAGVLIVPGAVDPDSWAKAARDQQAKYAGSTGEEPGA